MRIGVLIILLLPMVYADISITSTYEYYNIGEKITGEASLFGEETEQGYLKVELDCPNITIPFFLTPVHIQKDYHVPVDIPPFTATSQMKGQCHFKAELSNSQNQVIEAESSSLFEISDGLEIILLDTNVEVEPDTPFSVKGILETTSGQPANAEVEYFFNQEEYQTTTTNGQFSVDLGIPPNIPSGDHDLTLIVQDKQGNKGSKTITLHVIALPTRVDIQLDQKQQDPSQNLMYTAWLYDQTGQEIDQGIEVTLQDPKGDYQLREVVSSGEQRSFFIGQFDPPGEYVVAAASHGLKTSNSFTINEIRKINMKQESQSVLIENVGNVPYDDQTTLVLRKGLENFVINKKIKLAPGEVISIDVSTEVPSGRYDILVPTDQVKQNDTTEIIPEHIIATGVSIDDNRGGWKKLGDGFDTITGRIIGSDGVIVRSAVLAPLILIGIIVFLFIKYRRKGPQQEY